MFAKNSTGAEIARPDPALIPMLTRGASWVVDVRWDYMEKFFDGVGAEVDLDPDFQRHHVWTARQQRRYVEFILRGGQTAKELFFNSPGWPGVADEPVVLVDGKQRLEAQRLFLAGGLEIFGGWKLSDFPEPRLLLRHNLAGFKIRINDLKTRREVLQWYLDINAGGVAHTDEEIGNVRRMLDSE